MKVGIMSMQRIQNYGSFLQAYALKKTIESLGHEVVFVDYHPGEIVINHRTKRSVADFIKLVVRYLDHRTTAKKRRMYQAAHDFPKKYNEMLSMIGVSSAKNCNSNVDVMVIGSDEVFNCLQDGADVGFSPVLFGHGLSAKKTISYAASFGFTTLEMLKQYGKDAEVASYLNELDAISVRDKNSYSIVEALTNKPIAENVDPVLIYEFQDEVPVIDKKDFIVVYAYRGRISKDEGKWIKQFAKKHNKTLVALGGVQDFCDEYQVVNGFEVLGYIKAADYVITDTFHGAIFSIKYGKKFAAIIRDSNRQKLGDLLTKFDVSNRAVYTMETLEDILKSQYDINNTELRIANEKSKAVYYLDTNLKR